MRNLGRSLLPVHWFHLLYFLTIIQYIVKHVKEITQNIVMGMKKLFKNLITERTLSFAELAKKTGVSARTIQEWYYHDREPSLFAAEKVLLALGYRLTIEKIKEGEECTERQR